MIGDDSTTSGRAVGRPARGRCRRCGTRRPPRPRRGRVEQRDERAVVDGQEGVGSRRANGQSLVAGGAAADHVGGVLDRDATFRSALGPSAHGGDTHDGRARRAPLAHHPADDLAGASASAANVTPAGKANGTSRCAHRRAEQRDGRRGRPRARPPRPTAPRRSATSRRRPARTAVDGRLDRRVVGPGGSGCARERRRPPGIDEALGAHRPALATPSASAPARGASTPNCHRIWFFARRRPVGIQDVALVEHRVGDGACGLEAVGVEAGTSSRSRRPPSAAAR